MLRFCQVDWNLYLHLVVKASRQLPFLPLRCFTQITVLTLPPSLTFSNETSIRALRSVQMDSIFINAKGLGRIAFAVFMCVAVLHIVFFSNFLHSTMCSIILSVIAVLATSEDKRKTRNNNYLSARHGLLRESKS